MNSRFSIMAFETSGMEIMRRQHKSDGPSETCFLFSDRRALTLVLLQALKVCTVKGSTKIFKQAPGAVEHGLGWGRISALDPRVSPSPCLCSNAMQLISCGSSLGACWLGYLCATCYCWAVSPAWRAGGILPAGSEKTGQQAVLCISYTKNLYLVHHSLFWQLSHFFTFYIKIHSSEAYV